MKTINEIWSRNKIIELSPMIIKESYAEITNTLETANIYNTYFTRIGSNLTNSIYYSGEKNHKYYFKITQNKNLKFKEID